MNDKTKIYDYACSVVNFDDVIKCKRFGEIYPSVSFDDEFEYKVDDAAIEFGKSDEGGAWLRDWAKGKLSGNPMLNYKEQLITHTVKALTKLYNDGYQLEVK